MMIQRTGGLFRQGLCLVIFCAFAISEIRAVEITYEFSTAVTFVNSGASGFPPSLSGVSVNDPITGTIEYDADSPAAPNPLGGVFQLATYYPLTDVSISINV